MLNMTTSRRTRVLITASAPFAGLPRSASHEVAKAIDAEGLEFAELTVAILPVDYAAIPGLVADLIANVVPDVAIGLGVELGAPTIRLETTALNFADFAIADNFGRFIRSTIPFPDEPEARSGSWPAPSIAGQLRDAGIPAIVSHHAGTHLCNLTYYALLRGLQTLNPAALCGYAHVALLPDQVADFISAQDRLADTAPTTDVILPSMPLDMQIAGIRLVLNAAVRASHAAMNGSPVLAAEVAAESSR